MTIKSVREINFFQALRDRQISISFCDSVPGKSSDEILHFVHYLVAIVSKEISETENIHFSSLDKDYVSSLLSKLSDHSSDMMQKHEHIKTTLKNGCDESFTGSVQITGKINLTFLETVQLHSILEYFENNFEKFKICTKNTNIPHQLSIFVLVPSNYYNSILTLKNILEHKLGGAVVNSYKLKYK